ncbi:VWA domain-containing protein [Magnetovirga frankeli]|uniref:VWA domain-containing protein n=1 Tax=Magnetovirga frankeli TaxID=947516 RepID=UPI0012941597|nr:VWA domain-containing protein [gamma proteobacterium SS-5]
MNLHFHWPWLAWLLLLPLLVRYLWPRVVADVEEQQPGRQQTLLNPSLTHLRASFGGRTPSTSVASRLHQLLLWGLWTCLCLALMQPQWLEPYTESRTEGYDLMLAVDASHSMEALDFSVDGRQVTRMAVLKGVMDRFIANRPGDRLGLIIFGSQAYTLSPLTYDLLAVRQQLSAINPNIAGQGTAMGDAIGLGVKKLRERPEGSRVMLLIADGNSTDGSLPPLEAARLAAASGIRIYAIGVGSDQKSVQIFENGRLITRDDLGFDEKLMQQIAATTAGAYFRATDSNALSEIARRISELEKTEAESRTVLIPHPLYHWPLAAALLLLLLLGLFPDGRPRVRAKR